MPSTPQTRNPSNSAVVLSSGGVDSCVLLDWALQQQRTVLPVYCRFGLFWEKAELHWLGKFLHVLRQPRLLPLEILQGGRPPLSPDHWSLSGKKVPGARSPDKAVYLPGRNILLLTHAAVLAAQRGIPEVWMGTLAGNPFSDATPAFFRSMERLLRLALGTTVSLRAPFRQKTKPDIFRLGKDLPLQLAFSCLHPVGRRPCGACNKCTEHAMGLQKNCYHLRQ